MIVNYWKLSINLHNENVQHINLSVHFHIAVTAQLTICLSGLVKFLPFEWESERIRWKIMIYSKHNQCRRRRSLMNAGSERVRRKSLTKSPMWVTKIHKFVSGFWFNHKQFYHVLRFEHFTRCKWNYAWRGETTREIIHVSRKGRQLRDDI